MPPIRHILPNIKNLWGNRNDTLKGSYHFGHVKRVIMLDGDTH